MEILLGIILYSSLVNKYKANVNNLLANASFSYELMPSLNITVQLGYIL